MTETAPDGGPAPRRPTGSDPLVQLSMELTEQRRDHQRLREQQTQLASDLSELGSDVRTTHDEIRQVAHSLNELATSVAQQLGEQEDDSDDRPPRPVDWWLLDREQARETWDQLWTWVEQYLVPTFALTRDELVDCWPRHRALRDVLTAMWVTQRNASHQSARATADIEWQVRYRKEGMATLGELTSRLGCSAAKCAISGDRGAMPGDNEITRAELWHRDGIADDLAARPEPEPDEQE